MSTSPIPLPVERSLRRLGQNLSRARRRRGLTQRELAERIGASVDTIRRMEEGSPGMAVQHLARAMQVFGALDRLDALLDTANDAVGLLMVDEALPQRVRKPRVTPETGAS